jgi:uncharacterized metal-binding protein
MTPSTPPDAGFFTKLIHRARHSETPPHPAGHDRPPAATPLVINCSGCGSTSEIEVQKGLEAAQAGSGSLNHPCPHCGQEMTAATLRRAI